MYLSIAIKLLVGMLGVIFFLRISGKTQMAQLTPLDSVNSFVLGALVGGVIYNPDTPVWYLVFAFAVWTAANVSLRYLMRFHRIRRAIKGDSVMLVRDRRLVMREFRRNGLEMEQFRYVFEYPDWVNVIAITKEGKFVFIDQYRHGLGETDYEIPAGVAEPDDASMLAAAQRELAEETGYGGGQWRELMVVAPNPSTQNNLTYCYLATGVERLGEQHLDATEDIRVHLFSGAEVRELLESGRIRQALMAAPLWRYAAEYGL